jgi:hypothetical protein
MSRLLIITAFLFSSELRAQIQSASSGDWYTGSTWVGGNVPTSTDDIEILAGHVITLSAPVTVDMPGNLDIAGTLELTQGIGGTANKHILPGGVINSSGGTMSGGGEWVVESGGELNVNSTSYIGSSTTIRNHGTFNWLTGHINEMGPFSCYYGAPPPSYIINETDGTWNIAISSDFHLGAVWVTNNGELNKTNASALEFHNACAGSTLNNTSTGTLHVLDGQITFNSGSIVLDGTMDIQGALLVNTTVTIGADITLDGTLTINGVSDFSSTASLTGSGVLNVGYALSIGDNFIFTIPTINAAGSIGGAGIKTYTSGVNVNLNGGGLAGLEHIIQPGAVVTINGGSFGSSTTIRNQGTINWESGFVNEMGPFSCFYGSPPPAILLNETNGTVNLNQPLASHLGATHTTNNGVFNKTTSSIFTFHSGCSGSPFTNAATGVMNGVGTMQFDFGFANLGTIAPGLSPGELTLNYATVPNAVLDIQLASASGPGTGHDRLNVNGNFVPSGTLNVTLDMGYAASGSPTFEIVSATGTVSGMFSTINYPPGNWYIEYNTSSILIGKISLTPGCTGLIFPTNGATSVSPDAIISWSPVMNADGYFLSIGTSPGGTDLANNLDIGNVTFYDYPGPLPFGSIIYVTIYPYNGDGPATGCAEQSFTIAPQCPAGSVSLTNQTQVNAYVASYPYCSVISGNLDIGTGSSDITNISGLNSLTQVLGYLHIVGNSLLTNISGLDNLTSVGGDFWLWSNPLVPHLNQLNGLTTLGGGLDIWNNASLQSISLPALSAIGTYFWLDSNPGLLDLTGLSSVITIGGYCYILNNDGLLDLSGLDALASITGYLKIENNDDLQNFSGLSNLATIGQYLSVEANPSLLNFTGLGSLSTIGGYLTVKNNASLVNFTGMENLASVAQHFTIDINPVLLNLTGLSGLQSIGGDMNVWNNQSLVNFSGAMSLASIGGNFDVFQNGSLVNFNGLGSLSSIGGFFRVWFHSSLLNMAGLNMLSTIGGDVTFQSNGVMTTLTGLSALTSIGGELRVWYCGALTSMTGLQGLLTVGDDVFIQSNDVMTNIAGLTSLTTIGDSLTVWFNAALQDMSGLGALEMVGGDVTLQSNGVMTNLTGLSSLISIEGELRVWYCGALTSLTGVEALMSVGGNVFIQSNDAMIAPGGLTSLSSVGGELRIWFCPSLTSLTGLEALLTVGNSVYISSNQSLSDIQALSMLTSVGGNLVVSWNPSLTSLSGLENVNPLSITHLELVNSGQLSICGLPNICEYVSNPANSANISGNAAGCATRPDLEFNCTDDDNDGYGIALDCNDNNAAQYPGATEICNSEDDDCDGMIDEGLADDDEDGVCDLIDNCVIHYNPAQEDADMDGIGDECDNCPNHSNPGQEDNEGDGIGDVCDANDDNDPYNDASDCAPFNALIYPGATEVCGDLLDNNCNGLVDEPLGIVVLSEQDIFCNGQPTGMISVEGSCGLPPYAYSWSNGASTSTIANLPIGTFKVTVTDAQGLTKQQTFSITQPTMLSISVSRRNVSCHGSADGAATATANGGVSPYTYLWSHGATTKTADNLVAGTYTVTVTDNNLCTKTASVTITQPTAIEITSVDVVPDPGNPGKFIITVYAQGGTPYNDGYRYRRCNANGSGCAAWKVSNVFTNMAPGTHLMKVKDKIGCTDEQLVTVENTPALMVVPRRN